MHPLSFLFHADENRKDTPYVAFAIGIVK
jgi:hypothetical protein